MLRNSAETESPEDINMTECEKEGMYYVGGFLCFKLAEKYPWMGSRTSAIKDKCSAWMSLKSRGGLYMPSDQLQQFLMLSETIFQKYHGPTLSLEKNPISRMTSILVMRFPDYPEEIIALYSRTRLFLRLKYLNSKISIKEKHFQRRHANHVNKYK